MKEKDISLPIFPIIFVVIIIVALFWIKPYATSCSEKEDVQENAIIELPETNNEEIVEENNLKDNEEEIVKETDEEGVSYTTEQGETYTSIGIVNIPSLGIKYPILSTTTDALLKISVTKYWGPNPNKIGNLVIVGHNYRNTKFFSKLPNIKIGEIIQITDVSGETLDYTVYNTYTVDPNDNSPTSQLTDGKTEVTLITCYNNNKERFIVKARAENT